jgi:hypothetical protein
MTGSNIRIENLGTDKYEVWCVQMRCYLIHSKLWHAVRVEPDQKPSAADNDHACALILLNVDVIHYATIQHLKSADKVWDILEKTSRGGVYATKAQVAS